MTPIASECLLNIGPELSGLEMCETAALTILDPSILSAAASPASLSASLESDSHRPTSDGSGLNLPESFANYDPDSCSWRTYQGCLFTGWATFSETWPRAGTMRSGRVWERMTLERRTDESESGLWPTPQAQMPGAGPNSPKVQNLLTGNRHSFYLTQAVEAERQKPGIITRQWPTPKGSPEHYGRPRENDRGDLQAAVRLWSTPTVRDANTLKKVMRGKQSSEKGNELIEPLPVQVGGTLNPTWTEWLMGFPLGWTDLEDSETPSYPKSQNGLDAGY